jgi:glutamyl/glutaminyl-tRNA synthetase
VKVSHNDENEESSALTGQAKPTAARVRFTSPTGRISAASRTALFSWLRPHTGGQFLIRIEDTDALDSGRD